MLGVLSHFAVWLLGCLLAGGVAGYAGKAFERRPARWLIWAGLAFSAAVVAELLGVFDGRAQLRLETGLAAFALYLAGCMIGALARGGSLRDNQGWAYGVVPLALLWLGANSFGAPALEAQLRRDVTAALERAGAKADDVAVLGRDVMVVAEEASIQLLAGLADLPGVARVSSAALSEMPAVAESAKRDAPDAGKPDAAAASDDAAKSDAAKSDAAKSDAAKNEGAPAAPAKPETAQPAAPGPEKSAQQAQAPQPAPETPAQQPPRRSPDESRALLSALPASGELPAGACQDAVSATLAVQPIKFRSGRASIRRVSAPTLDRLATLLQRCPKVSFEVAAFADAAGADAGQALSQRRAEAVVKFLERWGVAKGRLTGVGRGARPGGADDLEFAAK